MIPGTRDRSLRQLSPRPEAVLASVAEVAVPSAVAGASINRIDMLSLHTTTPEIPLLAMRLLMSDSTCARNLTCWLPLRKASSGHTRILLNLRPPTNGCCRDAALCFASPPRSTGPHTTASIAFVLKRAARCGALTRAAILHTLESSAVAIISNEFTSLAV